MARSALWVLAIVEVLGLVGLFAYVRAQARRRATGRPRPPRAVRISVALVGVVVAVGFPLLVITAMHGQATRGERQRDELARSGRPATGVITDVEETGKVVNRRPEVRLHVTVEPPGGRPFHATATWVFSVKDVQSYRVGTRVNVYYDPADRRVVAVVGALPAPAGP